MGKIKASEVGWLAGFIDADGSIGMSKASKGESYIIQVQITGTDPRALEAIADIYRRMHVGFNVADVRNDLRGLQLGREKHARAFNVNVTKRVEAYNLLNLIAPYLVIKRDRALLALEFLNGRVFAVNGRFAPPYTERDHAIYAEMRSLQTSYKEYANADQA
jgi:hypothetical protein